MKQLAAIYQIKDLSKFSLVITYAHADKCIYFQQDMRLIILTLACKGFLISGRCHVRFATLVDKKRDVRDDIKYT